MDDTQVMDYTQDLETESDDCDIKNSVVAFLEIDQHKYELKEGTVKLGRDPSVCKIVIENQKTLSKEHAVFEVDIHSVTLSDLGSRNKTRIGKLVLKPHILYALQGGEHLRFGAVRGHFTMNVKVLDTDSDACSESMLDISSTEGRSDTGIDDSIISPTPLLSSKTSHEVGNGVPAKKSLDFIPETPAVARSSSSSIGGGGTIVMESPSSQSTPMGPPAAFKNFLTPTSPVQLSPIITKQPWNSSDLDASITEKDNLKLAGGSTSCLSKLNYSSDESTDEEDVFDEHQSKCNSVAPPPDDQCNKHNGIDSLNDYNRNDNTQDIFHAFNESPKNKIHKSADNTQDILEAFGEECDMGDSENPDIKTELFDRTNSGTLFKRPMATPSMRKAKVSPKPSLAAENNDIFDAPTQVFIPPIISSSDEKEDPSEMPTQRFSMSFLTDEVFDAPTQVFEAPTQVSEAPTQVYDPPTQVFEAPTQVFEAPTQVYDAPTQVFEAPTQVYDAPTQVFEAPTQVSEAPTQVYDPPTQVFEAPTQVFEAPTQVYDAPTQVFEAPTQVFEAPTQVSDAPTQIFEAPTQVFEAPTVSDAPTHISDAPTQVFEAPTQVLDDTILFDSMDKPTQVIEASTRAFSEPRQTLNSPTHVPGSSTSPSHLTSPTPGNCSIDSNEPTQVFMMNSPSRDDFEAETDDTHLADTVIIENSDVNTLEISQVTNSIKDRLLERTTEHSLVTCASSGPVKEGKNNNTQSNDFYINVSKDDDDSDSTISEPLLEQRDGDMDSIDETVEFNDSHLIPQSGKENSVNVQRQKKTAVLDNIEMISVDDTYANKTSINSQTTQVEIDQTSKNNEKNLDTKDYQDENEVKCSQFPKTNSENKDEVGSVCNLQNLQGTRKSKVSHEAEYNSDENTDVEENYENFLLDTDTNSKPPNSQILSEEKLFNYNSDTSTDIEDVDEKVQSNLPNNSLTALCVTGEPDTSQQGSDFLKLELTGSTDISYDRTQVCKVSELNETQKSDTFHKPTLNDIRYDALKTPSQNSDSEFSETPVLDYSCFRFVDKITVACPGSENETRIQKEASFLITTSPQCSPLENEMRTDSGDSSKVHILFSLTSESDEESIKKLRRVKKKKRKNGKSPPVKCLDFTHSEIVKENKGEILESSNPYAELECRPILAQSSQSPRKSADLSHSPIFKGFKVLPNEPEVDCAKKHIENVLEPSSPPKQLDLPEVCLNKPIKSKESSEVPHSNCQAPIQHLKAGHSKSISPSNEIATEKDPSCSRGLVGTETRSRRTAVIKKGNLPAITSRKSKNSQTNTLNIPTAQEKINQIESASSSNTKQEDSASCLHSLKSPKGQSDSKQDDNSISKNTDVKTELTLRGGKILKDCKEAGNSSNSPLMKEDLKLKTRLRDRKKVMQDSEGLVDSADNLLVIKEDLVKPKRLSGSKKNVQNSEEIRETGNINLLAIKEASVKPKRTLRGCKKVVQDSEEIRETDNVNLLAIKETSIKPKRTLRGYRNIFKDSEEIKDSINHSSLLMKENLVKPKTMQKARDSCHSQDNAEKSKELHYSPNSIDQTILAETRTQMKDTKVKVKVTQPPPDESLLAVEKQSRTTRGRKSTAPNRYSPSKGLPSSNASNGISRRSKRNLAQVEDTSIFSAKVKKTSEETCKSLTEQENVSQMYDNSCKELCSDHNAPKSDKPDSNKVKRKKLFKEEENFNVTCKRGKWGESEEVAMHPTKDITFNLKETRTRTAPPIRRRQTRGTYISDPGEAKASASHRRTKKSRVSEESETLELPSENLSLLSSPQTTKTDNTKKAGVSGTMGKMDEILCKPRTTRARGKKQANIEEESEMEICLSFMSDSSQNSSHHLTRGRMQPSNSFTSKRSEASPRCSREEILWSPSQRQALASKRPRVLFTGFKDPKDEKVVKDSGGLLVETATDCSVLVTNAVKRTCKFIACLGKGIPIVSREWISASKRAGNLVDPWKYLVIDKAAEKKFGFSLKKSLEVASKRRLFTGYSIHVTDSVKPPPDEMKEIVVCAGGEFLDSPPVLGSPKTIIISCPEDKKLWPPLNKLKNTIVNTEFILTGLLKQKILIAENKLT